jgi:guanylate kinase
LLVLSSPSGGGKTSIAQRLVANRPDVGYSVSATTRPPREGETDGQSYWFWSRSGFERAIAAGEFLEWAEYGGNLYGTLRGEVAKGIAAGKHVVLDIEVQGAEQLRTQVENGVHVFVLPPSGVELVRRLAGRGTEDAATVARRVAIAGEELGLASRYDYLVINNELDQAVAEVSNIIDAECRRTRRQTRLDIVVSQFRRDLAAAANPERLSGAS